MADPNASVLAALITAGASLVVSVIGLIAARGTHRRTLEQQAKQLSYQKQLKHLEDELAQKKSDRDARRDYEYEARKRLYQECSPLLFQLSEQVSSALGRIQGIAQSTAEGKLEPGADSWFTSERSRYYRLSTEYRLFAPVATCRLLRDRLTNLDLSLDPEIHRVYLLLRLDAHLLADDFEVAKAGGVRLAYDPHHGSAQERVNSEPRIYYQQGIPQGIFDNVVECLLVREGDGSRRVMSYLEYEQAVNSAETNGLAVAQKRVRYLFADFHPRERPVLWRLLLAKAGIYRGILAILHHPQRNSAFDVDAVRVARIADEDRGGLSWMGVVGGTERGKGIQEDGGDTGAIDAVNEFLLGKVGKAFSRVR